MCRDVTKFTSVVLVSLLSGSVVFGMDDQLPLQRAVSVSPEPLPEVFPELGELVWFGGPEVVAHAVLRLQNETTKRKIAAVAADTSEVEEAEKNKKSKGAQLQRAKEFPCLRGGCNQVFTQSCNRLRHMKAVHEKKKPYVCEHSGCGRGFSRGDHLANHQRRVHRTDKQSKAAPKLSGTQLQHANGFACLAEGCSEVFTQSVNLSRHIKAVHEKKKPYVCEHSECGRRFSRSDHLANHQKRMHTAEKQLTTKRR